MYKTNSIVNNLKRGGNMKKILLLMMLICLIVVGVISYDQNILTTNWGDNVKYVVTTKMKDVQGAITNGNDYIYVTKNIQDITRYNAVSIEGSDYTVLSNFVHDYDLKVVDAYWVEDIKVICYYSDWFNKSCDGINFQLADYGSYYKLGYPLIMEGF